ncbi:bifunctional enoyl-CoA hydratase/phosphate acetyltransferase [Sporohalobacter salinus]|uniref:bifunctional enoyl-CoA hydratase/phosphate acetyltransferase n=1 Tax=Sporohalobacter salinus TaxID=1494606 RepID=UPI00195FE206|nr:bifunctional enoyl-CoA hydratase/phosphate acetyltransferase [Sporohalobacter salinus]MBM7622779.1 phosphate butyryltransferase [Sporohalobacter salinus]
MISDFTELTELAKKSQKSKMTVAAPYDSATLKAISLAEDKNLVEAVLIGDREKILAAAQEEDLTFDSDQIINKKDVGAAAGKAVKLVNQGEAEFVMKGLLSTSKLLKAVLDKEDGLRTSQLLSYVAVLDVPVLDRLLIMTDPAMNIAPDLEEKVQITENAITVAKSLGIDIPKVALLTAVEKVNPKMSATLEAANLAKMGDRGQIKGAKIDGPLAFDNAISMEAKEIKGIESEVAGQADVLVVPDIEAGNILYKSLTHLAKATIAGMLIGAAAPVVLSSRSDNYLNKLNSIILGKVLAKHMEE